MLTTMTQKTTGINSDRIRRARERLMVSQDELAVAMGLQQQAIARWELGKVDPASLVVKRLAEVLEVSADYLLDLSDEMGDSKEVQQLSQDERKLLWLVSQGMTIDAIALIARLGKADQQSGVGGG